MGGGKRPLNTPPAGPNPFELSLPGKLEALFKAVGLKVVQSGSVLSPFVFDDLETAYQGYLSAGPIQVVQKLMGEERFNAKIEEALRPFQQEDNTILLEPNLFIYVVATR